MKEKVLSLLYNCRSRIPGLKPPAAADYNMCTSGQHLVDFMDWLDGLDDF